MPSRHYAALLVLALGACQAETSSPPSETVVEVVTTLPDTVSLGAVYDTTFVVRLLDENGDVRAGVPVEWQVVDGGGSFAYASTESDEEGLVKASWYVGRLPGAQRLQLALPNTDPVTFTTEARGLELLQVAAGRGHACGVSAGGTVWCWGGSGEGGTPWESVRPVQSFGGESYAEVQTTSRAACARTNSGEVWCLGLSVMTPSAGGPTASHVPAGPVKIDGLPVITRIWAGFEHLCGLAEDSTTWCWGDNSFGQTGGSMIFPMQPPSQVATPLTFVDLALGDYQSCGLTAGGDAYCWGRGVDGRLGGPDGDQTAPTTAVAGGHHFWELFPAASLTCGRDDAGSIWCWGNAAEASGLSPGAYNTPAKMTFPGAVGGFAGGSYFNVGVGLGGSAFWRVLNGAELWPAELGSTGIRQISGQTNFCAITVTGAAYCSGGVMDGVSCSSIDPFGCVGTRAVPLPTGGRIPGLFDESD